MEYKSLFLSCKDNEKRDVNIPVSYVLLSKMPGNYLFGGMLRDIIRGKKSNDVDIVCERDEFNFCFDQETMTMTDNFFEKLRNAFNFGTLEKMEVAINNKYNSNQDDEDEDEDQEEKDIGDEIFDQSSTVFSFTVDHIKYKLKLKIDDEPKEFEFIVDVSFVPSMMEFNGFSPACYQDSLYVKSTPPSCLSYDEYIVFLKSKLLTFCAERKTVDEIVDDLKNNLIEICNIETSKRCLKISRLVTTDGYKLKESSELGAQWNKMKDIMNEYKQKSVDSLGIQLRRMANRKFLLECPIYRFLSDENGFREYTNKDYSINDIENQNNDESNSDNEDLQSEY